MPSPLFSKLVATAGSYVDEKKASDVIVRQIGQCGATPDNFSGAHLKSASTNICGALSLYVLDKAKREEMKARILSLA